MDEATWYMSVWNELGSLLSFVRSDLHLAIMKRRREWLSIHGTVVGSGRASTDYSGSASPAGVAERKREFAIRLQFCTTVSITGLRLELKIQDRTI